MHPPCRNPTPVSWFSGRATWWCDLAGGETTVTLLHPPLPLVGVSIGIERDVSKIAGGWGDQSVARSVRSPVAHRGS